MFICLIPVWRPFGIFFSVLGLVEAVIFTTWQYNKLKVWKGEIDEQRFQDAYIYADENNTNFDPSNFKYSKKEEKNIKRDKGNIKVLLYTGIVLIATMIFLTIIFFKNFV